MNKQGQVYILRAGKTKFFKIGLTRGGLEKRVKALQIGCPYQLKIYRIIESNLVIWLEKTIHKLLSKYHRHGEWFEITAKSLIEFLDNILPNLLGAESFQQELFRFKLCHKSDRRCKVCGSFQVAMTKCVLHSGTIACQVCNTAWPVAVFSIRA